jgi:DNA-binding response OmpR family regulator
MSLEPGSLPAPSSPQPRLAPHLLVVEDEPVIASLLADVLTRHGYRVTIGHTVADGLALAEKHGDLALCISDFLC